VLRLGPTLTPFGPVTVEVRAGEDAVQVRWQAAWRGKPPALEIALPGFAAASVPGEQTDVTIKKRPSRQPEPAR